MQQTRLQNLSAYHSLRLPKLSAATLQKLCVADLTRQNFLLQPRCTSKTCLLKKNCLPMKRSLLTVLVFDYVIIIIKEKKTKIFSCTRVLELVQHENKNK